MSLENIDLLPNTVAVDDVGHPAHHTIIHQGLKSLKALALATDSGAVKLTGAQTIDGVKTFSSSPIVPTPTSSSHAGRKDYIDGLLAGKEPLLNVGSTGEYYRGDKTWQPLNKTAVGLGNVDNTSDANKPISTAMQSALDAKQNNITTGTTSQYYRGDKTWQTLNKAAVGLSNVDNTSDANKPVSTAMQTALNGKENTITAGTTSQYYRGDKTWQTLNKAAVGLGNVDNTSDANKPVSTAMQTALNLKANASDVVNLTGNQTISGTKTFSISPKMGGTATVGYVWTANSTDGSGQWAPAGTPASSVEWSTGVLNKPTTFPPIVGTAANQAAAGNHTHTKADIGLGNVDNTSDVNKPISTATQTALDAKVPTSRTISTTAPLTGGGNLSADRTISIQSGGINLTHLSDSAKTESIPYIQTLGTRAVGYGEVIDGIRIMYPVTITSVAYRMGTADASGTTTCHIRKNGTMVSGTSGTASTSPTAVTGSWAFAEGDILTVYTSAVGTTPGKRLTADIKAVKS